MPVKLNTLKGLQVVHKALLLGQIVFAMTAIFLKYNNRVPSSFSNNDHIFQVIAVVFSFASFFIGSSLFKKRIQELRNSSTDLKTKAKIYRSASIGQWALLETPSLFCVISFLLVGNYAFIALTVALMFVFALTMPSKTKTMLLLQLSEEEMDKF